MMGLSWPLWVEHDGFPRIPFVRGLPPTPGSVAWLLFGLTLGLLLMAEGTRSWRRPLGAAVMVVVLMVLQDQGRFQPWVYQFLLTGLAQATLPEDQAVWACRLFVLALYLHSGLSKLDVSFCEEMGRTFLTTALRPFGLHPGSWPPRLRTGLILMMPVWEILVAVGLAFGATRKVALAGAIALHLALLAILGRWGLGHSAIVQVWNLALIAEDCVLFGLPAVPRNGPESAPRTWWAPWTWAVVLTALVLPFGERWGVIDSWPGFALYASHTERTEVLVHEGDLDRFPAAIARHAVRVGEGPWLRIDLTGWSRAVRGVPIYPQARTGNGLAEALASRYPGAFPVRVVHWGRADRWTGRRDRRECLGLEAIRREGDRFRINAHPLPWGSSPARPPLPSRRLGISDASENGPKPRSQRADMEG